MRQGSPGGEKWLSLSVWSPTVVQEPLANFLVEQTGRGVQLEGEWITAYCHQGDEAQVCLKSLTRFYKGLQQLHPDLSDLLVIQENLQSEDWAESWKAFFKPTVVGKNIVLQPTWEPFEPKPQQVVIVIDPGRAFGTGKHPSTALCIEALEGILTEPGIEEKGSAPSVLDVGTGSGILGIVAAKLGAKPVLGLEIDSEALEVARANLERNGVAGSMSVSEAQLEQVKETYDVVVANLTAFLFSQMANSLIERVAEKGMLLVSGILTEQVEEVVKWFQTHYFKVVKSWCREEWNAILLSKEIRA
jgi:ribosomal protein L11 methyltransferase